MKHNESEGEIEQAIYTEAQDVDESIVLFSKI